MRAATAILLLLMPGAAMAQTATPDRSLQVVATAPSLCRMAPPSAAGDAVFTAEGGVDLTFTGGERLVAGEYQDELTVTFNPQ